MVSTSRMRPADQYRVSAISRYFSGRNLSSSSRSSAERTFAFPERLTLWKTDTGKRGVNTQSILRLCTESVVFSAIGCTIPGLPTKDSSRSQHFGFNRFGETRNETDARHLLNIDVVGTSELSWSLTLLSDDRSRGMGLPPLRASVPSRRRR